MPQRTGCIIGCAGLQRVCQRYCILFLLMIQAGCTKCQGRQSQALCEECLEQWIQIQGDQDICDAQKAFLESEPPEAPELLKLPSLPPTPKIQQVPTHQSSREKQCKNYQICQKMKVQKSKFCSLECEITQIVIECQLSQDFSEFRNKTEQLLEPLLRRKFPVLEHMQFLSNFHFIECSKHEIACRDREMREVSVLAYPPFTSGVQCWLVEVAAETKFFLKIGVSLKENFNKEQAFSDFEFGYAFFTLGQLRHKSNSKGDPYGCKCKGGYTVEVHLDMNEGTLGFVVENQNFGTAFKSEELKRGPVYPAIGFCNAARCTYAFKLLN